MVINEAGETIKRSETCQGEELEYESMCVIVIKEF